jgi:hypothetical protein
MAAITITRTDLDALSSNGRADDIQDILLTMLIHDRITANPDGTGFTITDPNANDDAHARSRIYAGTGYRAIKRHHSTVARINRETRYATISHTDGMGDADLDTVIDDIDGIDPTIVAAINQLSPDQRTSFVRHHLNDIPYDQIADQLGTTPGNARILAHRARNRILATLA